MDVNGPLCQGTLLGTQETKDVILTDVSGTDAPLTGSPRRHRHSFRGGDATFVSICPSGRQARSCLRPDGWPVPLLLSFFSRVPGSGFGSFHQRLKPPPPCHFPGAADRPGSLGNGKQGSPRTSRSRCSAQAGPVSWVARARAQEPPAAGGKSLTIFTPERDPLFHRPGCGSCRRRLGTPGGWAGREGGTGQRLEHL